MSLIHNHITDGGSINRIVSTGYYLLIISLYTYGANSSSAYVVNYDNGGYCRISAIISEASNAPTLSNYTGIVTQKTNYAGKDVHYSLIKID